MTDLESTAALLGVMDSECYEVEPSETRFEPGDVVAYTDGASEACDHAGEMLAIEGVRRLMADVASFPPEQWPHRVLSRLADHRNTPAEDDTIVMTLDRC